MPAKETDHAMKDAVEEFDRTMALRIASFAGRAIPADSIEEFEGRWGALGLHVEGVQLWDRHHYPAGPVRCLLDDVAALNQGEAYLQLPDGSQWVVAGHLVPNSWSAAGTDNRFLQRLLWVAIEHAMLRDHDDDGLDDYYLNRATLDLCRVFCCKCDRMVNLQADATEAEATLAPWENLEGSAWWCVPAEEDDDEQ